MVKKSIFNFAYSFIKKVWSLNTNIADAATTSDSVTYYIGGIPSDNGTSITFSVPDTVPAGTYKVSVGSAGNIKSLSITELTFFPGNLDPQITSYFTVSNSSPASGGADGDTTVNIKNKIMN